MNGLLLQAYPDTLNYMIAGYAVIFGMMLLYLISISLRRRNVRKELEVYRDDQD